MFVLLCVCVFVCTCVYVITESSYCNRRILAHCVILHTSMSEAVIINTVLQHNKDEPLHDLNVTTVWDYNITGYGATVCVVDDGEVSCDPFTDYCAFISLGVEQFNPDIEENFVSV